MGIDQVGRRLLCVGCLALISGCAEQLPTWIAEVPGSSSELCAIGVSGPTYYAEDARAHSKAAAMTELARALEVTVRSQLTIHSIGDSTGGDTAVRETAGFSSDVVLKDAQVREQWVHPGGDVKYGVKGTVYTLVCTPIQR